MRFDLILQKIRFNVVKNANWTTAVKSCIIILNKNGTLSAESAKKLKGFVFMKATGIVRRLDKLGRIVLPKELRRVFQIDDEDELEIYVEDDRIILKKYIPTCVFCQSDKGIVEYKDKNICEDCLKELKENV